MKFYKQFITYLVEVAEGNTIVDLKKVDLDQLVRSIDLSYGSAKDGMELVTIDVAKFDELWKSDPFYIGQGGSGDGVREKYQKALKFFLLDPHTRQRGAGHIEASEVDVSDDSIGVLQGRHRYSVLRDAGVKKLPVAMTPESIKKAKKLGLV